MKGDKQGFVSWAQEESSQLAEAGEYIFKEADVLKFLFSFLLFMMIVLVY